MFLFTGIAEYHEQLREGRSSCTQAVAHYLQNIHSGSQLNAFTEVYAAEAEQRAAELDAQRAAGGGMKQLHGVVISIKDVISYKDHPMTAASKMLRGFRPIFTATALQILLDEEAIVIGTCNCDEFAMGSSNETSFYGPALNAFDEGRVPGGSSGGSAVSVQADLCMLALGSDTGGSVRQPADFCGVIGLKPSYGSISRYGLIAYASSFDQIGVFGKSLVDVRLVCTLMQQYDPKDSTMNRTLPAERNTQTGSPFRIAFLNTGNSSTAIDPEIRLQIEGLKEQLTSAGHTTAVVSIDLLDHIVPAYYVLTTAEASANLSRYDGIRYGYRSGKPAKDIGEFYTNNRTEGFGKEVKRRIMLGNFVLSSGYYDAYYSKAQQVRRLLVDQMEELFNEYDALVMPVSPATAPLLNAGKQDPVSAYLADIFTVLANLAGLPALALPLFSHSNNMPFGVQIHAKRGGELTLYAVSGAVLEIRRDS